MRVPVDIDARDILDEIDIEDLLDDLGEKKLKAWMEKRRIKTDIFESRDHAIADLFSDLRRAIPERDERQGYGRGNNNTRGAARRGLIRFHQLW